MNLLVLVNVHGYIGSFDWTLNPDIKLVARDVYELLERCKHRILALDFFTNMNLNKKIKNITLLFKELISYFNTKAIENDKTIVDPHRFFLDNPYDNFFIYLVRHDDSKQMSFNVSRQIEQIFSGTTNIQNLLIGTNDRVVNKLDSNFTFLPKIFKGQEVVVENLAIKQYSIDKGPIESSNLANVLRSIRGLKRLFIEDLYYEDKSNHYRMTSGAIEASLKILEHSANQLDYIEIRTPACTLHMNNSIWSSLHSLGARNVRLCMIESDPDWTEVGEDELCSVFESYALEGCLKKLVWENVFSSQAITTILLSQGVQTNIEHLEIIHEHPPLVESSYKNRCDTDSIKIYNTTIDFIKGCKSCKTLVIPEVFITLCSLKQIIQEYEKSCIETLIITQVDDPQSKTKIVDVLDQFKKDDRPFSVDIKESRVLRVRICRRSPDHDIHFIKRPLPITSNSNSESSSSSITTTDDDDDQEMPPLKKIRDDGDQEPPLKKIRKN